MPEPMTQTERMRPHAQDFARAFLREVERRSRQVGGEWVPSIDCFNAAEAANASHPYVQYFRENSARRIAFTQISEGIRKAEFPHIMRETRNRHVYFRLRP